MDEKTKEEFKARFDKLGEIRKELSTLVDKDTESFNEFMKAVKMPKETEEQNKLRAKAIQEATIFSIEVPYKTASLSLEALRLLDFLIKNGNQNAITDIGVGTLMLSAGMEGAILNVKVNLGQIKDKQIYDKYRDVYYRFTFPEVEMDKEKSYLDIFHSGRKQFSIIILDKNMNIVGETLFPEYTYNPNLVFIRKDGLYLSISHVKRLDFDENTLRFQKIELVEM